MSPCGLGMAMACRLIACWNFVSESNVGAFVAVAIFGMSAAAIGNCEMISVLENFIFLFVVGVELCGRFLFL